MVSKFNQKEIQKKWIKRWQKEKIFEVKPELEKNHERKFYLTVAFPYPSGAIHVGHGRTYTVPDVIARFKRMQGYNVLFPMAWHVTGSPVLGVAERIKNRDEKTLRIYGKLYKVPEKILKTFVKPENIVKYFSDSYRENMTNMGYSIDWSRQFFSITPQYSKFIEWQYRKLHSMGLIRKGEHPVRYCPRCKNPVGDHDLLEGEKAEINEFIVIKFHLEDNNLILPAATLRPETIFGVTNMWLNPNVTYKKVKVDNEIWLLSKEAFEKLKFFKDKVEIVDEIKGEKLIGKFCRDEINKRKIPILPADFVDPDFGTGVVMSVPAHAPYDYIALKDLKSDIEAITIIDSKRGENPAKKIIEEMNIKNQKETEKLEKATEIIYREEHSRGIMSKKIPEYGGINVREAREKITQELFSKKEGDIFYEFSERPVICRCGSKCFIKILKDQWFVAYGNEEWKEKARQCLDSMEIIPPETRENFSYFIEWLRDWACTRRTGLGTKLPWDKKWIIEPLSDSTIYMAYYTISPHMNEINPEKLDDEFFDYIFLGEGNLEKISEKVNLPKEKVKEIREEFLYWYPPEWRLSAKDLVGNHLTFHIFHHTAIFPKDKWPKGIVVFGMGLMEGQKMSSSKGNVVLLEDAIEEYGSDTIRLFLMSNAEPWQDFNWQKSLVKSTSRKIKQFYDYVMYAISLKQKQSKEKKFQKEFCEIDKWLLSRVNLAVEKTIYSLEKFQIRKALQHCFFMILNDITWYLKRAIKPNPEVLFEVAGIWIRLMAPFTPFVCEELWENYVSKLNQSEIKQFNKEKFVSFASYPNPDKNKINKVAELKEDMIKNLIEDINKILEVTKVKPNRIYIYLAPEWKRKVFKYIKEGKNISEIMKHDPSLKKKGKEISQIFNKVRSSEISDILLTLDEEYETLSEAREFLEKEFNAEVKIEKEIRYDPKNRAKFAQPMKVGIYIE